MPVVPVLPPPDAIACYEVYSRLGQLRGNFPTLTEAERLLGASVDAQYIVAVTWDDRRVTILERKELLN